MLGRHHDGGGADRLAVLVLKADLRLGVGAEQRSGAGMARFRQALGDAVREVDRRRHQRVGLAAGVAEHDALVAGAFVLVAGGVDADTSTTMQLALGDALAGELLTRRGFDQLMGDRLGTTDLTRQHELVGRRQRFDSDAGIGVMAEIKIDDSVGNAVADLVWMALGN